MSNACKSSKFNIETSTAFCIGTEKAKANGRVSLSELLKLDVFLEEKCNRVWKDDGCNTKVMSYEVFNKNKRFLR